MMKTTHHSLGNARRARGYSLIEILVGIGIGMVAIVVIMQSLQIWDVQKRSTTSGADAQINGNIAVYEVDRVGRLGGMGFGRIDTTLLNCSVRAHNATRGSDDFHFNLLPIEITKDTTTGRDTLTVLFGDSAVMAHTVEFTAATAQSKVSKRRDGFFIGDKVLVTKNTSTPATCDLVQVSDISNVDGKTFLHIGGDWNRSSGTDSDYATGFLFNLGQKPDSRHITIDSGLNLVQWNNLAIDGSGGTPATSTRIAENIVGFKAQYGIAPVGSSAVTTWTPDAPTDWTTVRAVRVGILARSRQFEHVLKSDGTCCVQTTVDAPTWAGSAGDHPAPFVLANFGSSSGDADNWHYYRYRVYESTIPLRNMIWGQSAL